MQNLDKLRSPAEIQDFINRLKFNFEKKGETHRSVSETIKFKEAHCFEGALVAAYALTNLGHKPLLLDLKAIDPDFDHVVALFKEGGKWGAISKTNHAVLRYREPIYRDVRELAMSYFHEYFLPDGTKTLRSFSKPFSLKKYKKVWIDSAENLAWIAHELDKSPHFKILGKKQEKNLRKADRVERKAGEIVEFNI